jgi:hypothetical protein
MEDKGKKEPPLKGEAAKRGEWRGEPDLSGEEAGQSPPARSGDSLCVEEGGGVAPRTIAPPD